MDGLSPIDRPERPADLTFSWLYERVQDFAAKSGPPEPSKLARWSLWIGMSMAGAGLMLGGFATQIPPQVALWLAVACLAAEVGGLGIFFFLTLRGAIPQLLRQRKVHADEMDAEFARWQQMVVELRRFPRNQRGARLRFVTTLRQNMGDRMGLMFGGIQRLGVFPVLIALYLQFREWKWGDWRGAFDVSPVVGPIICFMVGLYAAGWLVVGLRSRLDTYVAVLEESLQE
jgi:hypothetical protein